eukprot:6184870-Pyramimonas_sp.AAC.1
MKLARALLQAGVDTRQFLEVGADVRPALMPNWQRTAPEAIGDTILQSAEARGDAAVTSCAMRM